MSENAVNPARPTEKVGDRDRAGARSAAGDTVALLDRSAAQYDGWYQTPLGALTDALEREAVFFPPFKSARLLAELRRLERPGRRWMPGMAAFLAVTGDKLG